jgi:hypothetical protein
MANSLEMTLDLWAKRKWYKKLQESFAHIFSPML